MNNYSEQIGNTGLGALQAAQTAAPKASPMYMAVDGLNKSIEVHLTMIDELERKLSSIMSPRPVNEEEKKSIPSSGSPLTTHLNTFGFKIVDATRRLSNMLDSIDL